MSDHNQARLRLEAAEKDVSALRGMGDDSVFADEIFGFHVQQAAEKLLKAWIAVISRIISVRKGGFSLFVSCGLPSIRYSPSGREWMNPGKPPAFFPSSMIAK